MTIDSRKLMPWLAPVGITLLAAAAFASVLGDTPADGVTHADRVDAATVAAVFVGFWGFAYYGLSTWLVKTKVVAERAIAIFLLVASVPAFGVTAIAVLLSIASKVDCGPDAYECPL